MTTGGAGLAECLPPTLVGVVVPDGAIDHSRLLQDGLVFQGLWLQVVLTHVYRPDDECLNGPPPLGSWTRQPQLPQGSKHHTGALPFSGTARCLAPDRTVVLTNHNNHQVPTSKPSVASQGCRRCIPWAEPGSRLDLGNRLATSLPHWRWSLSMPGH